MFWGQALIELRRTNKARSWPNFRAWHLKTDSKSAFATSLVGSRSPPLTTSFGISAFDMSRGTRPQTLPMSSRMHHFPNRRPPDLNECGDDLVPTEGWGDRSQNCLHNVRVIGDT